MKRENETKHKLLEVAMRLIWEQSYGSVGVDEICKQAGVTKGSFYFAFPSKAALAAACFDAAWEHKKPLLDGIFSARFSAREQLEKYCVFLAEDQREKFRTFGKMCGCPFASVGSEVSTQDDMIRHKAGQMAEGVVRYFAGMIRTAQAEGLVAKEEDPALLGRQLFDFVDGVILHAKIENNPSALDRVRPGMFRLLGLREEEPAAA
ncbi:MAG: TetR/AcrR family transcriptional regulator [Verrucomicrobium sp.]|nr:TetR/AcrR family transcriptional regulator [Verrucomicrobium sp.]